MPHQISVPKEPPLTDYAQAFENTSTNVAAAQMRNSLTNLAESVTDPEQKKVWNSKSPGNVP
jgi:hypothetical protein